MPAPVMPVVSLAATSAAGAAAVPFRPRNSRRLAVCPVTGSLSAWNAALPGELRIEGVAAPGWRRARSNAVRT